MQLMHHYGIEAMISLFMLRLERGGGVIPFGSRSLVDGGLNPSMYARNACILD
jgi:hypothetical protein